MGTPWQRTMMRHGFALLVVVATLPVPHAAAQLSRTHAPVSAKDIEADLREGRPVLRSDAVIKDRLDLSAIGTIDVPFRCRGCRFKDGIDASDTVFSRTVDLAGARFDGSALFRGTTFRGPAVFAGAPEQAGACYEGTTSWAFGSRADFSLAVFDDLAGFDSVVFNGPATFENAQFHAGADFGHVCFVRSSSFRGVGFERRASFTQSQFTSGVSFDAASYAEGATFLGGTFSGRPDRTAASFAGAVSAGDLDFTFVHFTMVERRGKPPVPPDQRADSADFSYLVCSGAVSFRDADFSEGYGFAMDHVHIGDLMLDVDAAGKVDNDVDEDYERAVLRLIESSAKERGDLSVANDAQYQLDVLASKHYSRPWRALDLVFYRGVTGYLVRPWRPLLVLFAAVVVLALIRTFRPSAAPGTTAPRRRRARNTWTAVGARSRSFFVDVFDTMAFVVPRRDGREEISLGRRVEILIYRVLAVCALVALANANPTLREMVDSLF